jgi:hypothetical protein
MNKDEVDHVSFQLFGMKVTIQFTLNWYDPGLNGGESQTMETCTIIGRHVDGQIFKAAGVSIVHPTDMAVWEKMTGRKLALASAAEALYWGNACAYNMMSLEQYQKVWWSAYQRKIHDQPDWVEPPSLPVSVVFI